MYFVPHFGHAKVYETSIWTPCFQISAKTLGWSVASHAADGQLKPSLHFKVEGDFGNLVYKYKHFKDQISRKS